ncbi:hypothetical protein [Mesorhizobium sp. WSM3860]|uniref:hypothetical protein n=1 Tax=Mesorhizobium sp. WSM3860 TaxID=2029403 RepID=UPI001FE00F09|nr:hypothetical protein [Mesorhizobium sp. WSM3860]
MIIIGADNNREIAVGALEADPDVNYCLSMVVFNWGGCDERDEVSETAMSNCSTTARSRSHSPIATGRWAILQSDARYVFNSLLSR